MSSPRAMVSLEGWTGLYDWSTCNRRPFRKDILGRQGGNVAHCTEELIKCTENCYEIGNRQAQLDLTLDRHEWQEEDL